MSAEPAGPAAIELSLFPLGSVLFPGGLLGLKVFEARYLDLISRCLRSGEGFGVVALRQGSEVRRAEEEVALETTGTLAEIIEVDSPHSGILAVRCRGTRRFELAGAAPRADGLWVGRASFLAEDESQRPDETLRRSVDALRNAVEALKGRGAEPFLEPLRYDDAGWVANRWCEILPISQAAKQKLMALPDPMTRLHLVDDYLESKGVVA
jgi:uncharacterized protein